MTRTGLPVRFRPRAGTLTAAIVSLSTLFASPLSWAQPSSTRDASASGQVRDASGGVLQGATVEALVAGRVVATTTTAGDGRYRLDLPARTPYDLRVRRDGFADQVVAMAGSSAGAVRDVTMQIGGISDTLVVTASRLPEGRARVTETVSVLTAADAAALGSASLGDVIRQVPGVNVEGNGREGALSSLFSRGGESDYNLVLIDGVRVNQSGGGFDVSRVGAGEIERVEVVRGAQSALYGSDAMGAVVQVFTRRAAPTDGPQVSGRVEGGSLNTWRGAAGLSGGARQRVDYHVGAAARRTDGAFAGVLPEDDTFDEVAIKAAAGAALGSRASLRTSLRSARARGRLVGPIAYGARDTGTAYDSRDLSWHLGVSHLIGSRVTGTATAASFRSRTVSEDAFADPVFNVYAILTGTPGALFPDSPRLVRLIDGAAFERLRASGQGLAAGEFLAFTPFGVGDFPFTSVTEFRRPAFTYRADLLWGGGRLSAGYEYERETNPLVDEFEVRNQAIFVQQQFSVGERWFATIGGRLDDKSRYGSFVSPKLSIGGFLLPFRDGAVSSVKVFANAGRGLKSPQFSELFGGPGFDGNLDLKPERARSVDGGAEVTFASQRVRGGVTYFDNRFRDMVEFRSTGFGEDGLPDFLNVAGAKASGWEIEGVLQRAVGGFTARGSYTFLDSKVTETVRTGVQFQPGQPMLRRPRHAGAVRASYAAGAVAIHVDAELRGERHDSSFLFLSVVPSGESTDITVTPGYAVAGLGVDVRAHEGLTIFLRGNNITSTEYEAALGFPGLPRTIMAGARFTLGARSRMP